LVIGLFLATILCFVLGYYNYGAWFSGILMLIGGMAARYSSFKKQEYIYNRQRENRFKLLDE